MINSSCWKAVFCRHAQNIVLCNATVTLYLDSKDVGNRPVWSVPAKAGARSGPERGIRIMGVHFTPQSVPTPDNCPALVLNADYRPLSYYPLSIWNWQTALKAVFLERVDILSEYETQVHSPSLAMNLPSVIALKKYIRQPRYPAFTRFNLFLRDEFTCQYCGSLDDLTFDHVIPRRLGGRTSWTNITTACAPCNLRKGGRTPHEARMHPRHRPIRPTTFELHENGRAFPPNYLHESWRDYLYWDTELES